MTSVREEKRMLLVLAFAILLVLPILARAQTTAENQLRATISSEIMADPRSAQLTAQQRYSLVNALTLKAQQQGITSAALTYTPQAPGTGTQSGDLAYGSTFTPCTDVSCSLSTAFGLNGSIPLIPITLFIVAALFILIYSIMRKMGHPHAQA